MRFRDYQELNTSLKLVETLVFVCLFFNNDNISTARQYYYLVLYAF